jgi:hypothetical protein
MQMARLVAKRIEAVAAPTDYHLDLRNEED